MILRPLMGNANMAIQWIVQKYQLAKVQGFSY